MGPAWASAFLAAASITLAGTPLLRKLAIATDFVDHPIAAHKSHKHPTPYLGGIGLIVAVLIGLLFTHRMTPLVGVIALGGSLIGCLGLLDDHRSVGALFRFTVELGVAAVALSAGLRIHATDVPAIDAILTLIWIVGITNAVNLLDNMDGLAAGVSAAAATAIFALAVLGEQLVTATVAAGLVGACAGFLVHNKRPATIFMGDTGSLFLGFVLALAAIEVSPALTPPASFLVPLMLLALPVLDTVTVTLARLRRGRSISEGGKDHLSHRLVARGVPHGTAVGLLVAAEAAVGFAAVLAGRDVIPLPAATLAAALTLAAVAAVTLPAKVYTEPVIGLPGRMRWTAGMGLTAIAFLAAPAAVAMARAHGPGIDGAEQVRAGISALRGGDAARAAVLFDGAAAELGRADKLLGTRAVSLGLLVPGVRANVATTRAIVAAGYEVARSASDLSSVVDARTLNLDNGPQVAADLVRLAPALERSAAVLQRSIGDLAGYDRPYLAPSVAGTVRDLRAALEPAHDEMVTAAAVAKVVPALLGTQGPRTYFLALQDNAELRGTGGVIHLWGEISADGGRLRLSRFGAVEELNGTGERKEVDGIADFVNRYSRFDPAHTWENVNVSPDFAVTGRVVSTLYPLSGGRPVDGVLALDAPGVAALLDLAGPVTVEGWPAPLTGQNFVDVVMRELPRRYPDGAERQAVVAGLYRKTLESVLSAGLGPPARLAGALAPAVRDGHLLLYARGGVEQDLFERLGAAGELPPVTGDSILVVNQNLTATPVDAQLRRSIRYDVRLDPGLAPASVGSRVEVTLANGATGENRSEVSVYSPFALTTAPAGTSSATDLGRRAYSTTVTVPSQRSSTVAMEMQGRLQLAPGHWYHLDLHHQTSLAPDAVDISLSLPEGWRIVETRGGVRTVDGRRVVGTLSVAGDHRVSVRVERTAWSRLWARSDGRFATPLAAVEPARRPRVRRPARPGPPEGPGPGGTA